MPFTPEMRRGVDQIRDYLYGGGYPDPVSNAEQLSFLFFFYLVEGLDQDNEDRSRATKRTYASMFAGKPWTLRNPLNAPAPGQITVPRDRFRWSVWARGMSGAGLVTFVRDEVFPFYLEVAERSAVNFMDGARLVIDEPTVLAQVITLIDRLRLDDADSDTKGDLFEHILKQIKQAGELGQFRTPRHIIRAIVSILDPKIGETIYDPAAGTAGFLVAAFNHIRLANSAQVEEVEQDGKRLKRGHGEKLTATQWNVLNNTTFYGNDVDPKMVHLATMNLTLRGLANVRILKRNVLTTTLERDEKAELGLPSDGYRVVLANPPFSGRVDKDRIVDDVKVGTTTATELLFLKYMMDSLDARGRCGLVVPEGLLFGSTGAHKEIRRELLESYRVEAVLSLPGGVFQPYSGVKTSALIFARGGATERVLFLHADEDGFKLDAQHDQPIEADDLPSLVDAFRNREAFWRNWRARGMVAEWGKKWWFADIEAIRDQGFNLSAGRYRPITQAATEHRDPVELLDELRGIEAEI
ncbi:MAG: N-6 DNA methylase, partial [Acetobacteraceae bacterium]